MPNGGGFGRELWETPVGKVVEGIDVLQSFYSGYGDMPPWGKGPVQQNIHTEGRKYIDDNFPLLSHFNECEVRRFNPNDALSADRELLATTTTTAEANQQKEHAAQQHTTPKQKAPSHQQQHHPQLHHHNTAPKSSQSQLLRKPKEPSPPSTHHTTPEQQRHANNIPVVEHVTGQLHHQHGVHLNASQEEEGLTKLSWELLGGCVILFLGVFILWLRFALAMNRKSRKTS